MDEEYKNRSTTKAQERLLKKQEKIDIDELNKQKSTYNQMFNDNAQQAYIQKMQVQRLSLIHI